MKAQLKIRTEYSFRNAYGPIESVIDHLTRSGCWYAAITDRSSTFGHVNFNKLCKIKDIKPIFGVELAFTPDVNVRVKRQELYWLSLLARNDAGLRELYATVEEATSNFHYVPRLPIAKLADLSQDILILSGNSGIGPYNHSLPAKVLVEAHPATNPDLLRWSNGMMLPVSDNYMITPENREAYEIAIGRGAFNRPAPMHILSEHELRNDCPYLVDLHFTAAHALAHDCNAVLRPATNIKSFEQRSLLDLCIEGATKRNLALVGVYRDRMYYELTLIKQKGFEDYFKVIADMVQYAKSEMLVGPARGSSCGSLVCYLLGITDIDPLPHHLIFERFIDITREDLPDIDIDFQDDKRDLVFSYLETKYGRERVARLGTISRFKAKSAIGETGKAIRLNKFETDQIADIIIKRNDGDDRADFCIADSLTDSDIGSEIVKRHPNIMVAAKLEAHAKHSGTHAAGVVITNEPINQFVSRDVRNNTIHLDKYDSEHLNLMKIDALGLKTLTIIADCLEQIGWTHSQLLAYPLDDDKAFSLLRNSMFAGIFQFAGNTLQGLTRNIQVDRFNDLTTLTALARPGPLINGSAHEWCARRNGKQVELLHPLMKDITADTYGLIVYQEQMLRIVREIGGLNWEDTTALRKGMSKSLGLEYFEKYYETFKIGARQHGIDELLARQIWETVNSAGGYAFNQSHSVAYSMVTYWTLILKAHFPLHFALATLKQIDDPAQIKQYLREMDRAGYKFKPYDAELSEFGWSVKNDTLIGGLTNIVGIGKKSAETILARRKTGEPPTDHQIKLLETGKTQFDDVFYFRTKYSDMLENPSKYGIVSILYQIADINENSDSTYAFMGRIVDHKIRSLNELQFLIKRDHMRVPNDRWLTLIIEDDSGIIPATVSRHDFTRLGLPLTKNKVDTCYIFRGFVRQGNRRVYINKWRAI